METTGSENLAAKLAKHILTEITKQLAVYETIAGEADDKDDSEVVNVHWVLVADCNLRGPIIEFGGLKQEDVAEYLQDAMAWADRNEVVTEHVRALMKTRWPWFSGDVSFIPSILED